MKNYSIVIAAIAIISLFAFSPLTQDKKETSKKDDYIELEVKRTSIYAGSSYLIELTKKGEKVNWVLPMIIGECEANSIARSMNKMAFERPLTYDLINSIFDKTSLKLKHIVITKLQGGTFYALLVIDDNGKTIEIDARPSDSINIALKAKAPIYATQAVIDDAKEVRN